MEPVLDGVPGTDLLRWWLVTPVVFLGLPRPQPLVAAAAPELEAATNKQTWGWCIWVRALPSRSHRSCGCLVVEAVPDPSVVEEQLSELLTAAPLCLASRSVGGELVLICASYFEPEGAGIVCQRLHEDFVAL